MRNDIKLRAWDGKRMIYLSNLSIGLKKGTKKICPYAYFATDTFGNQVSLAKHEVMESTGLRDQNEQEIYENDILSLWDNYTKSIVITPVIWNENDCRFVMKNTFIEFTSEISDLTEIIGNTYERPELLK